MKALVTLVATIASPSNGRTTLIRSSNKGGHSNALSSVAPVNEALGTTLFGLSSPGVVVTLLVQISRAPAPGEQPPAQEPAPAIGDEPS